MTARSDTTPTQQDQERRQGRNATRPTDTCSRSQRTLAVTWSTPANGPRRPHYLTPPQVAAVLSGIYSERTIRRRLRKGTIKGHQASEGLYGTWYVPRAEVQRLAALLELAPDWAALKR